jgi:nucleoid-associated protein YgaU
LSASEQLVRLDNESFLFDSKVFTDGSSLENLKNKYNKNYDKAKSDYNKSKEEFIKGDYLTSYLSSQEALDSIQKAFEPVNDVKKMQAQLEVLKKAEEIVEKSNQRETKKTSKIIKKTIIRKKASGSNTKTSTEFKTYVVKPKDTLHKIAGSDFAWKEIYDYNKNLIKNPDLIYPNQVIKIQFSSKPEAEEDIIIEEIYEEVDSIPETKIDEDTEVLEEDYMERMPQKKVKSRVRYP